MNGWRPSPAGLWLPARAAALAEVAADRRYDRPVGVDLFAGAGGFSLGLHQAGFHVAAAVEFDPWCAITYMVNLARPGVQVHYPPEREAEVVKAMEDQIGLRGKSSRKAAPARTNRLVNGGHLAGDGWIGGRPAHERGCEHMWIQDVRTLTGAEILDALGLERGEVDIVVGGPPCQGFSRIGKRDVMDPRNSLVFEWARLVLEISPRYMMMENVPDLVTMITPDGVSVIDALAGVIADGGWASYDAVRASLGSHPDARAVARGGNRGKDSRPDPDEADEPDRPEQGGLFDDELVLA